MHDPLPAVCSVSSVRETLAVALLALVDLHVILIARSVSLFIAFVPLLPPSFSSVYVATLAELLSSLKPVWRISLCPSSRDHRTRQSIFVPAISFSHLRVPRIPSTSPQGLCLAFSVARHRSCRNMVFLHARSVGHRLDKFVHLHFTHLPGVLRVGESL